MLTASVFRVVPLAMALETGGPSGIVRPQPALASGPMSPRPLSLVVGQQGIRSFVLERDEDHRLHSSSVCEVAQLMARVDYLQGPPSGGRRGRRGAVGSDRREGVSVW